MKIQIMGGKVCLRCKGKTLLGIVNKLLKTKSLLTTPSNVLPLHLKPIIWIFTEGEDDGIESRLPFKIFSTLPRSMPKSKTKTGGCSWDFKADPMHEVGGTKMHLGKISSGGNFLSGFLISLLFYFSLVFQSVLKHILVVRIGIQN